MNRRERPIPPGGGRHRDSRGAIRSLTITIDRTDEGLFRAEVSDRERTVIERADLRELAEELKQKIDLITVAPDGLLAFQVKESRQDDEAVARAAVESTALRREELDRLIEKYPVPSDWGEEPGWTDGSVQRRGRRSPGFVPSDREQATPEV